MQRVSYQQPSSSAVMGGGNSPRSFTLRELTSTMPLIITPSTMIPPQIAPSSTAAASSSTAEPAANMGNIASSSTTTTTTITTSSANDFSSIEMLSIFRGHVPMNCAVPADRTARMMVMKMFAKKVQHSKSFLSFVKMQFDGQGVKLWEALLTDDQQQRQQQQPQQEEEENALPLEIKGTAIDLVRLSKRDATFFYFTTRNAWSDTSTDSGVRSPLLNYPLGERSSLSGYDVFAFHATSPRTAERCFRLLQQFAEMNAASEQLMVKFGGGKVPGSSSSGGFFHMAGSLLSTPSLVAAVADAATSNTGAHTASVNKTTTIITNHNNNNITLPFASHCDLGNPTKSAKSSSLKSILSGGGGNGGKGEPREEHHVTFVSGLETNRRSEEEGPSPPFQSSQPPSADLLLLCDFNSGADQQKQHSASSMSDLFDDLVGSSSGRQAPPSSAGGNYQAANCEGDLLDDYSTSPLPKTAFTPVQQSQYFSQAPPPQRRPIQPQQQQPILVPTNPFAAPAPASAPVYSNFGVLNPFASVPLQPQPAVTSNGASGQSFCGGQPPAGKSLNTSAFSTDFNDFLQQTVKGHFKG